MVKISKDLVDVKKIPKRIKEEIKSILGVQRLSKKMVVEILEGKYDTSYEKILPYKEKLMEILGIDENQMNTDKEEFESLSQENVMKKEENKKRRGRKKKNEDNQEERKEENLKYKLDYYIGDESILIRVNSVNLYDKILNLMSYFVGYYENIDEGVKLVFEPSKGRNRVYVSMVDFGRVKDENLKKEIRMRFSIFLKNIIQRKVIPYYNSVGRNVKIEVEELKEIG